MNSSYSKKKFNEIEELNKEAIEVGTKEELSAYMTFISMWAVYGSDFGQAITYENLRNFMSLMNKLKSGSVYLKYYICVTIIRRVLLQMKPNDTDIKYDDFELFNSIINKNITNIGKKLIRTLFSYLKLGVNEYSKSSDPDIKRLIKECTNDEAIELLDQLEKPEYVYSRHGLYKIEDFTVEELLTKKDINTNIPILHFYRNNSNSFPTIERAQRFCELLEYLSDDTIEMAKCLVPTWILFEKDGETISINSSLYKVLEWVKNSKKEIVELFKNSKCFRNIVNTLYIEHCRLVEFSPTKELLEFFRNQGFISDEYMDWIDDIIEKKMSSNTEMYKKKIHKIYSHLNDIEYKLTSPECTTLEEIERSISCCKM